MLIASQSDVKISKIVDNIESKFKITNLGPLKMYLGVQVERINGIFHIHQKQYIEKILAEYGMDNAKNSSIPMDPGYLKLCLEESPILSNNNNYRQIVGSLLYLTVNSRPDIAVSVSILSRKVSNPNQRDLVELKRILKYLSFTKNLKLKVGSSADGNILIGHADADWAGDIKERKSTSGFIFKLGDGTISWSSRKQSNVTLSSTEAEYVSLSEACQEAQWLQMLLKDFGIIDGKIIVNEDNQSCLKILSEDKINPRTKHIDVKFHYVRELFKKEVFSFVYCPTENMVADILTKPLARVKFIFFREMLGLH